MTIYSKRNYRKIYEKHYGPIPKDDTGRSYDIHHIDGDHNNCSPENLKAVTVQEHYDIHYSQGDWRACNLIALRLGLDSETISELSRKAQQKLVELGNHHFLTPDFSKNIQLNRVKNGTHHFLHGDIQRKNCNERVKNGTHPWLNKEAASKNNKIRVENGTHHLLGRNHYDKMIANGTHSFQTGGNPNDIEVSCIFCHKTVAKPSFIRWHGDKCKKR